MMDIELSPIDKLDRELTDAFCQIVTITGEEGFESFSSLNPEIQQNTLFAVYNRIQAARTAFGALLDECTKERERQSSKAA